MFKSFLQTETDQSSNSNEVENSTKQNALPIIESIAELGSCGIFGVKKKEITYFFKTQ